jgi:RNA polymerase sigma factor (sigma-70 family)
MGTGHGNRIGEMAGDFARRTDWLSSLMQSHVRQLKNKRFFKFSREESREFLQQAYVSFLEHYKSEPVSPDGLLFVTARHKAVSELRSRRVRQRYQVLASPTDSDEAYDPQLDRTFHLKKAIEVFLEIAERREPKLLRLLLLRTAGYSRAEIAVELGVSVNAVEQRFTRAVRYSVELLKVLEVDRTDLPA